MARSDFKHIKKFRNETNLIGKYGEGNAHLIWSMALYLDYPDKDELASECLTDGAEDKKFDFIKLDLDNKKLIVAQGYYSKDGLYKAKANKASDLNTAFAWLISGDLEKLREKDSDKFLISLREIIKNCREAILDNEIEQIDILYVHNLAESKNIENELETVTNHLRFLLTNNQLEISVYAKELGLENIEKIFIKKESSIVVMEDILLPTKLEISQKGTDWEAGIVSIPATWLKEQFEKYEEDLFSANYRGFLGIGKKRKINSGIKNTIETEPENFWAFNNGITILTTDINYDKNNNTILSGISIINGAQTTGSIGQAKSEIDINAKVLCKIIKSSDEPTIKKIVKYNNTQNKITTWDQYSGSAEQTRIASEFEKLGYEYSLKRGFDINPYGLGIEQTAQPLVAFHGHYSEANQGKNNVFETKNLYNLAFENKKARHILLAFCLSKAIDFRRNQLKEKLNSGNQMIDIEKKQILLMRNLKFKYFFVSIFSLCIETLIEKNIDFGQVAIKSNYAKSSINTIEQLIVKFVPIITVMVAYFTTIIADQDFSTYIKGENIKVELSNKLKDTIYTTRITGNDQIFKEFAELIDPQG